MAKTQLYNGDVLTVTAPATKSSGDPVLVGNVFGIAMKDATSGSSMDIATQGVFTLPKEEDLEILTGALVYWDDTNSVVNKTAGGQALIGVAVADSADSEDTVDVRLNGGFVAMAAVPGP